MKHLEMTGHYDAPIDRVFEFATDFKRYPEWNVNYVEVKEIVGPNDQLGTKVHAVMKVLGREMDGWGEIVEVDRPKLVKMTSTSSDASSTVLYRFTPDGTGTKAEFEFDYELPAGIFGKVVDRLFIERSVERDLRHSMENSKAFVEANVPVLV